MELGLDLPGVWARAGKGGGEEGERIHVAILDSGVAPTRGLPDERIAQYDPSGNLSERRDRTGSYHGTQVASVLASDEPSAIGIAPQVRCSCFDVYNTESRPAESCVIAALEHAVTMKVDLICCTFTLERLSNELCERIEAARAASIPIVVSAATGSRKQPFPDAAEGLICVVASSILKTVLGRSRGSSVSVAAPGIEILASSPRGIAGFSGTSAAAPVAAGSLALALAHARKRGVEPWFRASLGEVLVGTGNRVTDPPSIDLRALLRAIDEQG